MRCPYCWKDEVEQDVEDQNIYHCEECGVEFVVTLEGKA